MILPILKVTPTRRLIYHLFAILITLFIYLNGNNVNIAYVGSTKTKFMYRINNYKSIHTKFQKKSVEKDLAIVVNKSELKQIVSLSLLFKKSPMN